jgi:hypothetical protein
VDHPIAAEPVVAPDVGHDGRIGADPQQHALEGRRYGTFDFERMLVGALFGHRREVPLEVRVPAVRGTTEVDEVVAHARHATVRLSVRRAGRRRE